MSETRAAILLVDDAPTKLTALEAALGALDAEVITAQSGYQALKLLKDHNFAVILLDVTMPILDGFETAALIRQRPGYEQVPIIFVTGLNTSYSDIYQGYDLGAVDYIFTPVAPQVLKTKVGVFVELWRKSKLLEEESALARARAKQVEDINEELETFCYSIAHDLRAPLRAMNGLAECLIQDHSDRLEEVARDYTKRIGAAAQRMDALIHDLLEYSRISRAELKLEPVDTESVLKEVLAQLERQLTERHAKVVIAPALPKIVAHRTVLSQVLSNLISNAVKFVEPAVLPLVRIGAEVRADRVRVWTEDNGIGIAQEYQEKIFRPFERLHDEATYSGTGIGLAIVRKGIERMGGRVGVESQVGHGSRFWIELAPANL